MYLWVSVQIQKTFVKIKLCFNYKIVVWRIYQPSLGYSNKRVIK